MENKSMKHGALTICRGMGEIACALWQHIDTNVRKRPWIAIFIVAFVMGVTSSVYMLEARAERNTAQNQLYDIQKKYDSLKICMDKDLK